MTWDMYLHRAGLIRGNRLRRVSDLTMNLQQLAGRFVALIEMPTPEGPTEAFFVAVALLADFAPREPSTKNVSARVFTLEAEHKKTAVAGEAIVGEWTRDGTHLNYGRSPCNPEAFLHWITCELARLGQNGLGAASTRLDAKKAPWWKFWKK